VNLPRRRCKSALLDEISINLVPVLFGNGTRLFENLAGEHTQLAITEVIKTATALLFNFPMNHSELYPVR
jgi:hypothetical protein